MKTALWPALKGIWGILDERNVALTAAGVAFYSLFAMFPAVGALIALWGFWQDPAVIQQEMEMFQELLPPAAYDIVAAQVEGLIQTNVSALGWTSVVSIGVALWSAMWAVDALVRGMNAIYGRANQHSLIAMLVSVALTMLLIAMALVALTVVVIGPLVLTFMSLGRFQGLALSATHIVAALGVVVVGLWTIFRFGPNRKPGPIGRLVPGVLLAVLVWGVASFGFSFFLTNFGRYNEVYGSLAAAAALLMWLYLSAYAVLLGAALNAQLDLHEGVVPAPGLRPAHLRRSAMGKGHQRERHEPGE